MVGTSAQASRIHKYLSKSLNLRAAIVVATEPVREMQKIQNTYPIATMAVGRSMMAAALMASHLKHGEQVSVYFRGDGPLEMVFAEANYEGHVRGYTPNPHVQLPMENGRFPLTRAIGLGLLNVVRTHSDFTQPHRGTVQIQTGEVGDDIAYYLQQSHQIPSVVSLGIKVDRYGKVLSAGGVLIELMPGANDETKRLLEGKMKQVGSLAESIAQGATEKEIADKYLSDFEMYEIEHNFPLIYTCRCSKERLMRSLELFAEEEIRDMIAKDAGAQAKCEFCGRGYQVTTVELEQIYREIRKKKLN